MTQKAVQVTWNAQQNDETNTQSSNLPTFQPFTVYRAQGEKTEAPARDAFEKVAENLTVTRFLDRHVTKDNTYWYTVTTKHINGTETERTEPVAATPREPPQLIRATYHQPEAEGYTAQIEAPQAVSERKNFWVIVTFDRRMNLGIGDESRYVLREVQRIDGVNPVSAIRDRMGDPGTFSI